MAWGPLVYSPQYDVWATGRHAQIELMMRDWKAFFLHPASVRGDRGSR